MIPMKPTPLRQLAIVSAGQAAPKSDEFSDYGTPFVRAGSLDRLLSGEPESGLELVSEETARRRKLKTYPRGTVLFAKSGMSATKDRVYVLQNPAHVVSHLATLIPKSDTQTDYLRLALKHFPPSSLIKDLAYPAIGLGDIESFEIPVPHSLDDQIRIAHLLGKVEGLIDQRKQHLQQLDDLLKSVFLEMFGDPVRNEKGWGKKQFSELLDDIESGKSPKCEAREAVADEWGVLKLGAVTRCRFDENENKALPQNVLPSVRDEVKAGDLLFSRKNTYDLVAACAYVFKARPKLLMPDLIFRFVFKKNAEINPIFIWKLLICDSQRKRIQSLAAGAAGSMPNISKANLKTVLLPIPPWPLQNQFATIVEKVEGIKSLYQQSLTDLEALYGALSQQAFKGELDLSRVLLPAQSIAPVAIGDQATVPEPVVQTVTTIHLPDSGNLPAALEDSEARKALIAEWLEAYCQQLGDAPFSVQDFMVAVSDRLTEWLQTVVEDEGITDEQKNRLAEFYPSNNVGLDVNDYEDIKKLVFEALAAGALTQGGNKVGNRIELKAVQS